MFSDAGRPTRGFSPSPERQKGLRLFDLGQISPSFLPIACRTSKYKNTIRQKPHSERLLAKDAHGHAHSPALPRASPFPPHGLRHSHRKAATLTRPRSSKEGPLPGVRGLPPHRRALSPDAKSPPAAKNHRRAISLDDETVNP